MERAPPEADVTLEEARRSVRKVVLTELNLGLTFLDVAATTTDRNRARRSVNHAITALRTADRFLSARSSSRITDVDAIKQCRERLAQRLCDFQC